MASNNGPKSPSRPTVKRLFALSGNRCAMQGCETSLIAPVSGAVVGEICHIKGDKPSSPRYDVSQDDFSRHHFENLILMCNVHHKVIDDNPDNYSVDFLTQLKEAAESRSHGTSNTDERAAEQFADEALRIYNNFGNAIHAVNVSGGQVANTITNNYGNAEGISEIVLDGKLGTSADLEMFHAFGCPVLTLKVVCRSIRPARIQKAFLCVEGQGILSPFEKGFGMSFAATVPGSSETMLVRFFYQQTGSEGSPIVLQQDQVARFVLPVLAAPMGMFLDRSAEELSVRIEMQDETEVTVCEGEVVSELIIDLIEISSDYECKPRFQPVEISVRCKAISKPDQSMAGQVNKNAVHFGVSPQDKDASIATSQSDLELSTLDWWDRPCSLARYTNMSQNSVPDCMYAAIAGAVSYLAGSAVWTPYRLFREYNRSDLKGVRFGVIDTALKPVFGRVERFQHPNGTTSRSLSPAEMREWIACGGIVILFLEASTPSGEALIVGQMFSLVASNATHFQVWDTRGFQGMLSDDEIVSGFKCPSGHKLSRSDLEYSLLLLRKVV